MPITLQLLHQFKALLSEGSTCTSISKSTVNSISKSTVNTSKAHSQSVPTKSTVSSISKSTVSSISKSHSQQHQQVYSQQHQQVYSQQHCASSQSSSIIKSTVMQHQQVDTKQSASRSKETVHAAQHDVGAQVSRPAINPSACNYLAMRYRPLSKAVMHTSVASASPNPSDVYNFVDIKKHNI